MADLSQTAANVKLKSATQVTVGIAGESLTQGQPVYLSSSKWYRCDANDTAAKAVAAGIALTPSATDGYVIIAPNGATVDLGATLTVGQTYVVSSNVGAIAPIGDLATGHYVTTLGVATAAGSIPLNITVSGVQVP
jgi:hypothetical protein